MRSPCSAGRAPPTSTASPCRSCCPAAPRTAPRSRRRGLVLDLERLQTVPSDQAGPLQRYAATIQSQRGDYNGKVLSIRQDDLRTLAVIYDQSPSVLTEQLIGWGVLNPEAVEPWRTRTTRNAIAHGA